MKHPKGHAALIAVLVVTSVSLMIVLSLNLVVVDEYRYVQGMEDFTQAHYMAVVCQDEALHRIVSNTAYTGGSISLTEGDCTMSVSQATNYTIQVTGELADRYMKIETVAERKDSFGNFYMKMIDWDGVDDF